MKKTLMLFALLAVGSLNVFAQRVTMNSNRMTANERQAIAQIQQLDQEVRTKIARGLERDILNTTEAVRLLNEYQRIEQRERQYLSNGRLTSRETRALIKDLENLSRRITFTNRPQGPGGVVRR